MEPRLPGGEIVVPFRAPRERLTFPHQVRTTLIVSSLRSIREHGLLDAYSAKVDPAWREALLETVAGSWLPIEASVAHYRACNAAVHGTIEQMAIGREVGDRLYGTFLGTMIRAAKSAGVTPWNAFDYTPKFYDRIFDGGGCCVRRFGPKDASLEMANNPLAAIPYFRNATRGLWLSAIELFCTRAYMREVGRTESSFEVRISWA